MGFGENLIELRKNQKISRKEVAEKLGIPYITLRNYEIGQREPGHKLLIKISELFSVSVDYLIDNNIHGLSGKDLPTTSNALNNEEQRLVNFFRTLNEEGQVKIIEYADDVLQSWKYKN